jgi:hypothetical protein
MQSKIHKRIGALFLSLALCLGLLPTAALAANAAAVEDIWDGTSDTNWYNDNETEFTLTTAEELAGLAALVNKGNTFENKTVKLGGNINLSGSEWTSIGSGGQGWKGTFDGQNYQINNLKTRKTDTDPGHGLFYYITSGTVENLSVVDADIESSSGNFNMGILADWTNGSVTIRNCHTSGTIHNKTGNKLLGGVIGSAKAGAQIIGCSSDAEIISDHYDDGDGNSDCDTVGGIVGQWENATDAALISDCWFGGSISCGFNDSGVGGILGANFDFNENQPGVDIQNCLVATREIRCAEPGNITWIGAVVNGQVTNCIWPDTPPDGVTLDEETYPDNKGNYLAVVKLVVDLNAGTAGADPNFNQSSCGTAVSDFTSADVLTGLNTNAAGGIEWVAGIDHPTFSWDKWHISADYTAVDAAIEKANALNENNYRDFSAVKAALDAVVRDKNITEQSEVDAMAKAIEDAINALVRKSSGGGSSSPSYSVTIPNKTENGTVTVSPRSAEKGDTVTITAKPDSGYQLDDLTVIDKNGNELKLTDKGNGKYTFTMPASKVEVNATFVKEVETSPFSDVSTNAYYYEAVKWAQEKGITGGIGNGLFGPNQPCTRAQIVTFLWRAAGSPEPKTMSSFADVSMDAYYAKAVAWAVENSITTGTGDGKFSPDATCTRAQSVTFLFRAIGKLVDSKAEFSDVLTDSYYANAVAWAVENGVTNGIGDGLFGPDNSCTRAQIVTFLYRAYQGK